MMNVKQILEQGDQTEKMLGVGLPLKKVKMHFPFQGIMVLNPYWIFMQVVTNGMPYEIIEESPSWTSWHKMWYTAFEVRHRLQSGAEKKNVEKKIQSFLRSKAGQECEVAFDKIVGKLP